jgi:octaprenyl-diphosphate synthase
LLQYPHDKHMKELKEYLAREILPVEKAIRNELTGLDPLVKPLAEHVMLAGGKRLRPILCILCARSFGFSGDDVYPLAAAIEFLHSATLLHDDILDNATLRRGRLAAHLEFGVPQTILAGDVLLALANKMVAAYGKPELMRSVSEAIIQTASGEILELARIGNPSISREDYFRIVTGKTAWLISAATECGAILAGCRAEAVDAARRFGLDLGIAFQLVDDALDFSAPEEVSGKPRGGDLREGKFTLPLLLYLESLDHASRAEFTAGITGRSLDESAVLDILSRIERNGCIERTKECARDYLGRAREALMRFPDGKERALLEMVLEYVRNREK